MGKGREEDFPVYIIQVSPLDVMHERGFTVLTGSISVLGLYAGRAGHT